MKNFLTLIWIIGFPLIISTISIQQEFKTFFAVISTIFAILVAGIIRFDLLSEGKTASYSSRDRAKYRKVTKLRSNHNN